jgi:glycine cleavage system H protein
MGVNKMGVPKELKYSKEHEWVKVEDDTATMGITDFAQHQLTDVVFVELPEEGKEVEQMGKLCVVESVKSVSDVFSPVSGEIIEVNKELEEKPELVNQEPYGKGWMAKLKIKDKTELDNLMTAEQYEEYIKEKKD